MGLLLLGPKGFLDRGDCGRRLLMTMGSRHSSSCSCLESPENRFTARRCDFDFLVPSLALTWLQVYVLSIFYPPIFDIWHGNLTVKSCWEWSKGIAERWKTWNRAVVCLSETSVGDYSKRSETFSRISPIKLNQLAHILIPVILALSSNATARIALFNGQYVDSFILQIQERHRWKVNKYCSIFACGIVNLYCLYSFLFIARAKNKRLAHKMDDIFG